MGKTGAILVTLAALAASRADGAERPAAADILARLGVYSGLCALVGEADCQLAIAIARGSRLTLFVQLADYPGLQAAARAAQAAGLLGSRIFLATGTASRIPLADNLADAVVALEPTADTRAEALRVLRPEGKALLGAELLTKPFPQGVDDWSHHYHSPDNNPQSRDTLARAPFLTQFVADPRYAPAPQQVVASAGRIFMAFGHIAWHEREEDMLDTLLAANAYNGALLWKKPLPSGFMVDRSTMIATPDALFVADDKSCKLLDPATGDLKDEIAVPADLSDGTFWKWIALERGVLYALVGKAEPPDPVARWRSTRHGWPWNAISKGYNDRDLPWGFARTIFAIDPKTKKVLWRRQEEPPIDARATCLKAGRLYIGHYGRYLACLDARNGKDIWRRTAEADPELFSSLGSYRPGQGYIQGWRTQAYAKCSDQALYFAGPQVPWLSALAADDGRFLWKHDVTDAHIVLRPDALYVIAAQNKPKDTRKLHPLTGQLLAEYDTRRRACTRATGSADGIFFRAHEGSGRFDFASGSTHWISPMRPSCHVGVIIANGLATWIPWACDCNLQLFGIIALAHAGHFDFDAKAAQADRLEKGPAATAQDHHLPSPWPTQRADNRRSASTDANVPDTVHTLWEIALPCEPTPPVMAHDAAFVADAHGTVHALDLATGTTLWTAHTGGRIFHPPTIAAGRAYVGSADGYAYAFHAATGALAWRFRAAPAERCIPVYGQLASTWPVASGVLVEAGTAYFAAGMNDFDGTHVYALDAATGSIKWHNGASGHLDQTSRRGVACQGELLLHKGTLYLAGGNCVSPGAYDAATGKCLNATPHTMGATASRGRELTLAGDSVRVSGQPLYSKPGYVVFDKGCEWQPMHVQAANARVSLLARKGGAGDFWAVAAAKPDGTELWSHPLPAEPVRWGIALDTQGRIVIALRTGHILCLAKRP